MKYIVSYAFLIIIMLVFHTILSAEDSDTFPAIGKDEYCSLLQDKDIFKSTGYIIYRETTMYGDIYRHGSRQLIEIFGDGTIIYIDNQLYFDDDGVFITGNEFKAYVLEDYDYANVIFQEIGETELYEDNNKYGVIFGNAEKAYYIATYVSHFKNKVGWAEKVLDLEEKYPLITSIMKRVTADVTSNGEEISAEEILELKEEYNNIYSLDSLANPKFIEQYIEYDVLNESS